MLLDAVRGVDVAVVLEPGRWIVGPAGVLVVSVVDVKPEGRDKHFIVLDAGMSELMRPALYGAYHRIEVLDRVAAVTDCDIVGPICESSDVLGVDRRVPLPSVGDFVAVFDTGAYGAAMASNYNRHAQPAEVLVDGGGWRIARRRQTVDDMLACEE
jgi:diaminopimelate decarboxylase